MYSAGFAEKKGMPVSVKKDPRANYVVSRAAVLDVESYFLKSSVTCG